MAEPSERPQRPERGDYKVFRTITTRFADNDVYQHINNAAYFSYLDTTVSGWLWENGLVVPGQSPVIGLAVSSHCDFFESLAFPDTIDCGMKVMRLGRSSVTYDVGIFKSGHSQAAAQGRFVHVYVDAATLRPVALPDDLRTRLADIAA